MIVQQMSGDYLFKYSLLKCPGTNSCTGHLSCSWMCWLCVRSRPLRLLTCHKSAIIFIFIPTVWMIWRRRIPAQWPNPAPGWLLARGSLKWNRSACPRVCVISMTFAYVNGRAPIAARLCSAGPRIGRLGSTAEPMGEASRRGPALPDTLRWEKQHGRAPLAVPWLLRCSLTHTPHVPHISCSERPTRPAGFTAEQRNPPLHPEGKVGCTASGRRAPPRSASGSTASITRACGGEITFVYLFFLFKKKHPEEFDSMMRVLNLRRRNNDINNDVIFQVCRDGDNCMCVCVCSFM